LWRKKGKGVPGQRSPAKKNKELTSFGGDVISGCAPGRRFLRNQEKRASVRIRGKNKTPPHRLGKTATRKSFASQLAIPKKRRRNGEKPTGAVQANGSASAGKKK